MKNEKKSKEFFKISSRELKYLWIICGILLVVCAYTFGFSKINDKTQTLKTQLNQEKAKQRDIAEKIANKDKFLADTEKYRNNYNLYMSKYDSGSSQDSILVFLSGVENVTDGWIKSTTFSQPSQVYKFGKSASGKSKYTSDYVGNKTTLTLAYEIKYDDLKDLIAYINNYHSKCTIDSIAMSYNDMTTVVSGTMSISMYYVTGGKRQFSYPKIDMDKGTDNLFHSIQFSSERNRIAKDNGSYILGNYDYYMIVGKAGTDLASCTIAKNASENTNSLLTSDSKSRVNATITFSGTNGDYRISYQLGDKKYPITNYSTGESFNPGANMELLVLSSPRASEDDKSGVNLSVINDSDKLLNVKVCNDDTEDKRVRFVEKKGNVNIYQ